MVIPKVNNSLLHSICRYSDSYRIAVQECDAYVAMLMEFNNMGELMRRVMTRALINPQVKYLTCIYFVYTKQLCILSKLKEFYFRCIEI